MALPDGIDGYWYRGCDHRFMYDNAKDVDGNFLNAGTCTYVIKDYEGTTLGTGTLSYVTDSDGRYKVNVDKTAVPDTVPFGTLITLTVTFVQSGNDDARILLLMVERRK